MKKSWVMFSIITMATSCLDSSYASEVIDVEAEKVVGASKAISSSLKDVLFLDEGVNLTQLANETITVGKEKFLQYLNEASSNKQGSLEAFTKIIDGIKMGFMGSQKVAYKDSEKVGKIVYNLAKQIAKARYDSVSKKNLPRDATFQRAIQELSFCYNLGVGVESNEGVVKLLSEYIPNDEDVE